jgi:hypothetical protein
MVIGHSTLLPNSSECQSALPNQTAGGKEADFRCERQPLAQPLSTTRSALA